MSTEKKVPALKLAKLPDRKPVRITVTLSVELAARLATYAAAYRDRYGEAEEVATLIPFMLGAFIDSDREFAKSLRHTGSVGR